MRQESNPGRRHEDERRRSSGKVEVFDFCPTQLEKCLESGRKAEKVVDGQKTGLQLPAEDDDEVRPKPSCGLIVLLDEHKGLHPKL